MNAALFPPFTSVVLFARPFTREEFERDEGVFITEQGSEVFVPGDFLVRFRGKFYVFAKEQFAGYKLVLGSPDTWGLYKKQ